MGPTGLEAGLKTQWEFRFFSLSTPFKYANFGLNLIIDYVPIFAILILNPPEQLLICNVK